MSASLLRNLEQERQVLLASVNSLAEFNLGRQREYESNKQCLINLVDEASKLRREIEEKEMKLRVLSSKSSIHSTLDKLHDAFTKADEESDTLAHMFLTQKIDFDSFTNNYIDIRKLAHSRRIKLEHLKNDLSSAQTL